MITKGVKQLCADAETIIETMTVEQVLQVRDDPNVELIDIRDVRELWRDGAIPGAWHVPRGMLEFWVDPESPYAKERFQSGKKFIIFCAGGLRSSLAALAVHQMGLSPVAHMRGGFGGWKAAGGPVETVEQKN
ncbi:MAG: rhodanese-like domain-containing protein [Alphaproteobacteria bacterium]|nr:rhodanese-like domain-containing protein [Alphaproteobacteria bacterium]